ncbi:maleylpyruvate isomerase family mycothiol-dependent enzyme [Arthrobacter sp. lap29]|uniref:maleylpyruvate isomerase family mycothiol-dependent enzyme n=1 Tax=Arthrobacter sp. lap29 TaxID=3056122 RepID=UPI0028F6FD52|nr:maleylpyruvate isomerase family mycothiol-dependent enzyme [Arthrobacter sp. lap29]
MNLEENPERAAQLCRTAQQRLMLRVSGLGDGDVRAPSQLPGWTVGHVLTHLARNADAHARRLAGSLAGLDVPKYENGPEQRSSEIAAGAVRPAVEILADLKTSMANLEDVFSQCSAAGWPNVHLRGGGHYGAAACPAHRLREVEMHHVDLGRGYTPADWPDEYVDWDLQVVLDTASGRLGSANNRRAFMAWLAGRGPMDPQAQLDPW